MEEQIKKLAKTIVEYSCKIKKGEKMLIECQDNAQKLVSAIVDEVYAHGGYPFVHITNKQIERSLLFGTTKEHSKLCAKYMYPVMNDMDAYVGITSDDNVYELVDVDSTKMQLHSLFYSGPIHRDVRVAKTKCSFSNFQAKVLQNLLTKARKHLKSSILMFAIWTIKKWPNKWNRSKNLWKIRTRCTF